MPRYSNKPRYYFIPHQDMIPGKIYGTRPDDRCSKYLYTGHCFQRKTQIKLLQSDEHNPTGAIIDFIDPTNLLKWHPLYNKILHHSHDLNQIIHDLIDLTETMAYGQDWRYHWESLDKLNFTRVIDTKFDTTAVKPESIELPWEDCFAKYNPHLKCYAFAEATTGIPAQTRTVYILKPWTPR